MGGTGWAFRCNACGRCCNSAPRLTVPELFRHQARFIGALALRVRRPAGNTPADQAGHAALLARLSHPLEGGGRFAEVLTLGLAPDDGACPARLEDGRCACHDDGKPLACRVVPLDATLPEALQATLLARRASGGGEYLGEPCIQPAPHPEFPLLARGSHLEAVAAGHLAAHREALQAEKRYWASALAASLPHTLWAGLATSGETAILPPAPVLLTLAAHSPGCRQRCLAYADAQLSLLRQPAGGLSSEQAARRRRFFEVMQATRVELASTSDTAGMLAAEAGQWLGTMQ